MSVYRTIGPLVFTVNYCEFANVDISIRFNGKGDYIVLELLF